MKKFLSAVLFLSAFLSFAQADYDPKRTINNYRFVIVPTKFDFLDKADEYQLNTFTKMHLEKIGFKVYFDNDLLPPEAAGDNCNKLFADLVSESNMFVTKLTLTLKDCMNKEVYRSDKGTSRDKNYSAAYRQALRAAFNSFETVGYAHNGQDGIRSQIGNSPMPVSKLRTAPAAKDEQVTVDKNTLFAQPVENGYQLVDTTPKVVFKLKKTSSPEVFIAEKDGKSGTLISQGKGKWVFEYYEAGNLKTEEISIKF